ncbi:MAG TPA: SRPBCC domain-containing protein [Trebonia sp.]|jgi:hypothetical protein|nr:SRPBCC domain-containing protein [Trebonia sp.]
MKTVTATTQIDAPPSAVWAVLTDLSSYPDWNPLFREASGRIAVGERITLRAVQPANGRLMTVKARIIAAEPAAELRWTSTLPVLMSGEHSFVLTPLDGGTRLAQTEIYSGLLAATVSVPRTETIFQALNDALKQRAESP